MTRSTKRPLIVGIPCDHKMIDDIPFHAVGEKYIDAVRDVTGAIPLLIPVTRKPLDIEQILDMVDGIFMPGSTSNVAPEIYGGAPPRKDNVADPQRDALTLPLIRATVARGMPLLAVCRGMQEMNVAFGGTLHQFVHELPGRQNHINGHLEKPATSLDERYAPAHDVTVLAKTHLARILGANRFKVNSVHHQGIDRLAEGLHVEAVAPDGTIEAVSIDDAPGFAIGVQWHPEWRASENPAYKAIFQAFRRALLAWARRKK